MKGVILIALIWVSNCFADQRELQFENEFVRVWKATISPHEPLRYHRHDTGGVLVTFKGGFLTRIEDSGEVSTVVFEEGKAFWSEPDPIGVLHTDINEGTDDIVVMLIEVKNFNAPGFGYGIDFKRQ